MRKRYDFWRILGGWQSPLMRILQGYVLRATHPRLLTNPLPFALSEVEGVNGTRSITHKNQQNQPSTAVLPFDWLRANGNKLSAFIRFGVCQPV
jgi:hypothetical protein